MTIKIFKKKKKKNKKNSQHLWLLFYPEANLFAIKNPDATWKL